MNGYAYGDNNPVTQTDPTGQGLRCGSGTGDDSACGDAITHGDGSTCHSQCGTKPDPTPPSSSSSQTWIDQNSVATSGINQTVYQSFTRTEAPIHPPTGGYWHPQWGTHGTLCFGLLACHEAAEYLHDNPHDAYGARVVAATYCLSHFAKCQQDARGYYADLNVGSTFTMLLTLAVPGEGAADEIAGLGKGASAADVEASQDAEAAKDAEEQMRGCSTGDGLSFDPDTLVLMADGTTKRIGDLQPGDKVQAANPDTGKHKGPRTVTATLINHDHDLIDLTVETSPGHTSVLHTNAKHPFWDDTTHHWVPAGRLTPGHALETARNTHSYVLAVHPIPGAEAMYNLTVDQLHTYYVLAGNTPVLVHNTCGGEERAAVGVRQGGVERTMDNSLDKTTYLNDVANKYGINLRGSGQSISVVFDPDLGPGLLGVTRAAEGGRVIRVGPDGIYDDATAANTIAHELSHARYYLRNGTFEGEIHGNADSMADGTPYGSGNALQDWIEGNR
jgi:hypothetical protein